MAIVPTTELEAVNRMLASIGEAPVDTLTGLTFGDAADADQRLTEVSRRIQARGWHWNTDPRFLLTVDGSGFFTLGTSVLKVRTTFSDITKDYVQRGQRLYDRLNSTFTFPAGSTVYIERVVALDWDDLPEVARQAIFISASREFQQDKVGSRELDGFKNEDELRAAAALIADELENFDPNMLTDSQTVSRIADRQNTSTNSLLFG